MTKPKPIRLDGANFEPVFRTEKGSIYYFDEEKALWLRRRFCGEILTHEFYFGSKSLCSTNPYDITNRGCQPEAIPDFAIGNMPFGLGYSDKWISLRDISVREVWGELTWEFKDAIDVSKLRGHLAHRIVKFYRKLNPLDYTFK